MAVVVVVTGAVGLVLVYSGLTSARLSAMERRVEPYLSGLRGLPSRLLVSSHRPSRAAGLLDRVVGRSGSRKDDRLAERLSEAGLVRAPADFRLEQLIWGLGALIASWAVVVISGAFGARPDLRVLPFLAAVSFACGWLGRDRWLTHQIEERRAVLREELPTAIDLVTLSIMAGESVPAAFERAGRVVGTGIGEELERTVAEIRGGAATLTALEFLKNRLPDPATVRFVDALCTGIERGAPLADVLRAQAADVREARRQHLLEMGGRREIVMLLPVVFLILPVVVVFALWPGLVSLDLLVP
jgi:tight adherence protein C